MSAAQSVTVRRVVVHEVVVPGKPGAVDSPGLEQPLGTTPWEHQPICLLEVTFDDGIVALGETGRGLSLARLEPWLEPLVGFTFTGLSMAALPEPWRATPGILGTAHPAPLSGSRSPLFYAIETALYDWAGKRLGCRMVDLLGGAYRERVPVDYWCGRRTLDDLRDIVAAAREQGFTGLKMKSRLGDPTLAQVETVREVGGDDFRLTIDPMFQWLSPHDALPTFRQLEPHAHGLRIEDPFPQDQPEFWRRVRDVCAVPLIWHARDMTSLRRALQERVMDGLNCAGSTAQFLTAAHAAEVLGYSCWHGSAIELGVAQVAQLHAAAAARSCVFASDFVSPIVREHTLITWDWSFEHGTLPLPTGPGLGVELDHEAVERYRTAHAVFE